MPHYTHDPATVEPRTDVSASDPAHPGPLPGQIVGDISRPEPAPPPPAPATPDPAADQFPDPHLPE